MNNQTDVLMEVKNLHHGYKRGRRQVTALQNISFRIRSGETLGIAGESGSGKSTLIRLLSGLEKAQKGYVYFLGQEINSFKKRQRRKFYQNIGVVFQQPQLSFDPRWPLQKSLEEPLRVHGTKSEKQRVKVVLENALKCGLDEHLLRMRPSLLSGGQLQRAAIARAIMLKPKLIFLDEPTAALDVSIQAQILNLLKELQEQYNLSYVFVSHDIAVLAYLSDRMLIIKEGEIVEQGTTEQVLYAPQTPYTKELIDSVLE